MSPVVCLSADTIGYPQGGGHLWAYLNWALGLRAVGCRVIWLESCPGWKGTEEARDLITALRERLAPYGLSESLAVWFAIGDAPAPEAALGCLALEDATQAGLLLNLRYELPAEVVARFRRACLVDIDPGLLQIWMHSGQITVAPHHCYFTIGETVGQAGSGIPDAGREWHHTPLPVAPDWWPVAQAPPDAPFTTVSHWYAEEWVEDAGEVYRNDKRSGFLPFLDLPGNTAVPLELALCLGDDQAEQALL